MNWAQLYADISAELTAGGSVSAWEEFFFQFYRAFCEGGRWKLYLDGLLSTIQVTILALILGVALGVVVAVIRTMHDQQRPDVKNPILGILNAICQVYTTVIRGTPLMVQLLILGFVVFANSRNFTMVGVFGLGLNSGAYVAEIVRGGLMGVDIGQREAGRSLGLNYFDTMRFIIIPQAFKNILPSLGNEFITLFKDTALISVIGGKELVYAAKAVGSKTYSVMFPYIGIAVVYLLLVMLFTYLQGKLERRLRESDRR